MKALLITILLVVAGLAGCANNAPPSTSTDPTPTPATSGTTPATPASGGSGLDADLLGDGSTFVAPLMDKWRTQFGAQNPGVTVSYTGGGSGKGRTDITNKLVDFAGSDAPMKDAEIANATDILHLPVAAGGVAIAYNVPEIEGAALKLDGETIAKIFLGTITTWNDPAIAALNPGLALPGEEIAVVHRSDGSGTTSTFTDYLNKVSAAWKAGPGSGSTVNWPAGTGANGNAGVGTAIQQEEYTIGYVGAEWSDISQIATAEVKNKAGHFVAPTTEAVSAALDAGLAAGAFDERLRGSVTNMDGAESYPIAAVTWVLAHRDQTDVAKGKALAAFLWYALHEGQAENEPLHYATIPASLIARAETILATMNANGAPLR